MASPLGHMLDLTIDGASVGPYDVCPGAEIYWQGVAAGKILLRHCRDCGRFSHPRQEACENCFGAALDWREAAGGGEIYSFSTVWRAPQARPVPYTLGMIMLDERVCLFAEIEQSPEIAIGRRVAPYYVAEDRGVLVKFRVVAPAKG